MTDTAKLRAGVPTCESLRATYMVPDLAQVNDLMRLAADEIEALRREVEALRNTNRLARDMMSDLAAATQKGPLADKPAPGGF